MSNRVTTGDLAATAGALQRLLSTRHLGRQVSLHRTLPSTQDEARRLAAGGGPHGTLVWTSEQTRGRGRMNRAWVSPAGAGLWFSLVLRPELGVEAASFLTIVAGVGVAAGLNLVAPDQITLKWPNDLILNGRKLGGILAEAETQDGQLRFVILGVGINLDPGPHGFAPEIAGRGAALSEVTPDPPDAATVLATVLNELELAYEQYLALGPEPVRRRWLEMSDSIGRPVRASLGQGELVGTAVDLAPDGGLVIETDAGVVERVGWGEVVHLGPREGTY